MWKEGGLVIYHYVSLWLEVGGEDSLRREVIQKRLLRKGFVRRDLKLEKETLDFKWTV